MSGFEVSQTQGNVTPKTIIFGETSAVVGGIGIGTVTPRTVDVTGVFTVFTNLGEKTGVHSSAPGCR